MQINYQQTDGQLITTIQGRLGTVESEQFMNNMQPLMDAADGTIRLDCHQLEYISSSGLRALLTLNKQVHAKGGKLILTGLNDEVKQVFQITGFNSIFTITDV